MDPAQMFRAVRRRQGWSQRELAAHSGVHARTIAAVESGERIPTLDVVRQVLTVAELELTVDAVPPPVSDDVRRHLRQSLTERLHRSLGGGGMPHRSRPAAPVWDQLVRLASCGNLVLHEELALAVWLPPNEPVLRGSVCFTRLQPWPVPVTPDLAVHEACTAHAAAVVAVSVDSWTIGVDPPADLALDPGLGHERQRLRAVARLLHDEAPLDRTGRRVRAHREPAHAVEQAYVFHTRRFRHRAMPDETNRRGWRLDDDASLAAWLRRYGYQV